jgi:hypothetical protein
MYLMEVLTRLMLIQFTDHPASRATPVSHSRTASTNQKTQATHALRLLYPSTLRQTQICASVRHHNASFEVSLTKRLIPHVPKARRILYHYLVSYHRYPASWHAPKTRHPTAHRSLRLSPATLTRSSAQRASRSRPNFFSSVHYISAIAQRSDDDSVRGSRARSHRWLRAKVPWYRRRRFRTVLTQWEGPLLERGRRQMHHTMARTRCLQKPNDFAVLGNEIGYNSWRTLGED